MSILFQGSRARLLAGVCAAAALAGTARAEEPVQLHEMTVTGTREGELKSETPASVTMVGNVEAIKPAHPSEIITRVPGAVMMQTSGEGHTTGLRHPIGTSPVYLYLEDGIPTRASGFFNHNAMYEINLPQAEGLEVIRGPGTALQGSDAIGGVFNVLTKAPSPTRELGVTGEVGSYGWYRGLGTASNSWGDLGARGDINLTHSDGWRNDTEYDRQSVTLRADKALSGDSTLKALMAYTNVDQQSGGTSALTRDDYEHNPTLNYVPNAFRTVKAFRASLAWDKEDADSLLSLTPYLRWNEMELLPPWAPSSFSVSGHESIGLLARYRKDFAPWRTRVVTGADLDYSPGWREEWAVGTTKSGDFYTSLMRGAKTYDYDVTFRQISPYVHAETSPVAPVRITGGLRADIISFDYSTNLPATQAGANKRPEDDTRYYQHLSPSLGATYAFTPSLNGFANYKHSFRVPGEQDLFKQGSKADSIHLEPVKVDSYEVGVRGPDKARFTWELSYYYMVKRDDILSARDAGGNTIATNNGRTHHTGVEAAAGWKLAPDWRLGVTGGYAEHTYEKWFTGGVDYAGKEIPSAPNWVGSATLGWQPAGLKGVAIEGEWTYVGPWQEDDANTHSYEGHNLFNLRGSYALSDGFEVFGRVMNLMDARWATSAAYNTREELSPGLPRTFYAGVKARF